MIFDNFFDTNIINLKRTFKRSIDFQAKILNIQEKTLAHKVL